MQIGVEKLAATGITFNRLNSKQNAKSIEKLLNRVVKSDEVGLDVFGIGEHHRIEFSDSAPHMILSPRLQNKKYYFN